MLQQVLYCAKYENQLLCCLLSDSGDTRYIINGISHKPHDLCYARRTNTKPLNHIRLTKESILHGVINPDMRGNKLKHILIACNDYYFITIRFPLFRNSADDIIRLISLQYDHRDIKRPDHPMDIRYLH